MHTLSLRLPKWLHKQLRERAKRDRISINQLVSSAAAEKLAALMTEEYIDARGKRASRRKFEAALSSVPNVEPEAFDRLPAKPLRRKSAR